MRGFKELVAFISHFPSFLDKTPLWRHKTLRCGSGTRLEADPKELEIPTPPRIASEAPHGNGEKEDPGSRAAPHGPAAPFWWHSAAIWGLGLEEEAAERQKPRAEGSSGWFGSPSLFPPRSSGEDLGQIPRAAGHTEDGTVTRGHILFSGCTRALFLLNSQSFIHSEPFPFSLFMFFFFIPAPPFSPPLDHSAAFHFWNILSARSLFSRKKPTDNSFRFPSFFFFFLPRSI